MKGLSKKEQEAALNEVRILASLDHPNIIQYKEAFIEKSTKSLCIVMEFADSGDLHQVLNDAKRGKTTIPEADVWKYTIQILAGLKYLHEMKICHRDLKCANVFLTSDGTVKLGDMGVSKVNQNSFMLTQTGTPYYICPEIWKGKSYNSKCDIWSLGVIIYELCMKKPPFDGSDMKALGKAVCKGSYTSLTPIYSKNLQKVIDYCLKVSASSRVSAEKLWGKKEVKDKIKEFDCDPKDGFKDKLLETIKVPIRLSQIEDHLPEAKYNDTDEEVKSSKQKIRLHSARPFSKKKLGDSDKTSASSKKDSSKNIRKKWASPNRLKPQAVAPARLSPREYCSPNRAKFGAKPSSAMGRRNYVGMKPSASPRNVGRPAGIPSGARRFY